MAFLFILCKTFYFMHCIYLNVILPKLMSFTDILVEIIQILKLLGYNIYILLNHVIKKVRI